MADEIKDATPAPQEAPKAEVKEAPKVAPAPPPHIPTQQEKLLHLIGKAIYVSSPNHKEPEIAVLKYVGKDDIVTTDGMTYSIEDVKGA